MFAKHSLLAIPSAVALLSAGLLTSAFAGPVPVDNSKDKKQVVQQASEPKWYFSLGVGFDVDYAHTNFSDQGAFGANARFTSQKYSDVYSYGESFYRIQGEIGYVASKNGEIFVLFKYSRGSGDTVTIGHGNFGLGQEPIFGDFGDYNAFGVEAGFRFFFLPKEARVRPYISFSAGATYVDDIDGNFFLSDGTQLFGGRFYQGGVVATGALLGGVEFKVSRNFSVGGDAGVRYEFPLSRASENISANNFNNAGDRLYCPITLYGKFRF